MFNQYQTVVERKPWNAFCNAHVQPAPDSEGEINKQYLQQHPC